MSDAHKAAILQICNILILTPLRNTKKHCKMTKFRWGFNFLISLEVNSLKLNPSLDLNFTLTKN